MYGIADSPNTTVAGLTALRKWVGRWAKMFPALASLMLRRL